MPEQFTATDLTRALAASARAFLEALSSSEVSEPMFEGPALGVPTRYDPLLDEPPLPVNPAGAAHQKKMSALAYLGAIARINAERGRGATSAEVSEYAKRAGYPDGRAVSGWNSRPGSRRVIDNLGGTRIVNADGHQYIADLAAELNLELVGDLTPLAVPGRAS